MTSSDFTAYVHQKVEDISVFLSKDSMCYVETVNIKKMLKKYRDDEDYFEKIKNSKVCISFKVQDGEFSMKAYGFGDTEFDALNKASDALFKQMSERQDEAISSVQRNNEIEGLKSDYNLH